MELHHLTNRVLRKLPASSLDRLGLKKVRLPAGHAIEIAGRKTERLLFLEDGSAARTVQFGDGSHIEVAAEGRDSAIGASSLLCERVSAQGVSMLTNGWGYSCDLRKAAQEFERKDEFHGAILQYTQGLLVQTSQIAGCNARHPIQQRLARWLLLHSEHTDGHLHFVPQELISGLLGTQRTTVSVAAVNFQRKELMRYARGRIEVLDRAGLEKEACECHRMIRSAIENDCSNVNDPAFGPLQPANAAERYSSERLIRAESLATQALQRRPFRRS